MKKFMCFIIGLFVSICSYGAELVAQKLIYDAPASGQILESPRGRQRDFYMSEALPLGNGHLGAMFNGGLDVDYLIINDITAWMNTVRGRDEVAQSGVQLGSYKNFETLRKATRDGQYGKGTNSIEVLGTKYIASKTPLGNYSSFSEIQISVGHNPEKVKDYKRELNLKNGVASVSYIYDGEEYKREYFCSFNSDVLVVRYTSAAAMDLNILTSTRHKIHTVTAQDGKIILSGEIAMLENNMKFQQRVTTQIDKGKIVANNNGSLDVKGANEVIIYLAGYTDYLPEYPNFVGRDYVGDCKNTIDKAVGVGYQTIKDEHVKDISSLMDRCSLNLQFVPSNLTTKQLLKQGNSRELELLYFNYARYLQTACSRGTVAPSNLQGIWNIYEKPMWNCDYHNDINLAMNYWMVETANLPQMFEPYKEWMKIIAQSGRYAASEAFGVKKGWSAGLNGNIFGFTAQNPHARRMQHSGAWLSQNLYENYSFSQDRSKLEEIYPIIKGAAEFFVEFLAPWKDGSLVVYPTWSPENTFLPEKYGDLNKLSYGASYDQQLVYNLFTDCIEASIILDTDNEFRQQLKDIIVKLCPQKIGSFGQLQEWPEDWDRPEDDHRHLSHLIALYPGRDISPFMNPELAEAAKVTMVHRDTGRGNGWKAAWRISLWARLMNGDEALRYYQTLCSKGTGDNLFNGRDVFQIDGNFGGGAGVCEMLLQSHLRSIDNNAKDINKAVFKAYERVSDDKNDFAPIVPNDELFTSPYILHLLPALPQDWSQGQVKGLRARGGFEVDIKWAKGKLTEAIVKATVDGAFRTYYNGKLSKPIHLKKGEIYKL